MSSRKGETMKNYVHPLAGLMILLALPVLLVSGCVTQQYVDQQDSILQGMISENSSNIASANKRIDSIEARANANSGAISALQADMTGVESRVDDVEAAVRNLKNQRVVRRVVLEEGVLFEFDKWTLTDAAKETLDMLASDVARAGYDWIVVAGHADSVGSVKYNRSLGIRRAQSVAAYLAGTAGLDRHKIIATTYGEEIPVFSNDTSEGRSNNRRVEIVVYRTFLSSTGEMTSLAGPSAR